MRNITENTLLRLADEFIVVEDKIGERGKLYHVSSLNQIDSVNPLMLKITKLLMKGQRPKEVASTIMQEHGVSHEIERKEVLDQISSMFNKGILVKGHPGEYPYKIKQSCATHPINLITLELTKRCNLACLHCYARSTQGIKNEELTTDEVKRLIDDAAELGVWQFHLTGGEPFMREDILDILQYVHTKRMVIQLFTNATLISDEVVEVLVKLRINQVVTSLNGLGATHDYFHGLKGAYTKTSRIIGKLKEAGIPVRINTTLHKYNENEFLELIRIIKRFGFSYRVSNIISVGRGEGTQDLNLSDQRYVDILASIQEMNGDGNDILQETGSDRGEIVTDGIITPRCGVGVSRMFISAVGDTGLCEILSHSTNPKFGSGNIRQTSIAKIWEHGAGYDNYRSIQCKDIEKCKHAATCRGGCRGRAYIQNGGIDKPDKIACLISCKARHITANSLLY